MSASECGTCEVHHGAHLQRLGLSVRGHHAVVALAGNPNTGKSTVFNALTGLRQHVGNWAGTTVARAQGGYRFAGKAYMVVDLPGTYSLLGASPDEQVARDFLLFGRPDVTVIVVDATRLERNLNLALQVLQITARVVVALNLMDEADRRGVRVDVRHLSRELGVPVVPMSARSGDGVPALLAAVDSVAADDPPPVRQVAWCDKDTERAVKRLTARLRAAYPDLVNAQWFALRLLEADPVVTAALREGRLGGRDLLPSRRAG